MMKIFFSGNTVIKPGDPVLLYGDGLMSVNKAKIARLADEEISTPEFVAFATPVSIPTRWEMANSEEPVRADEDIELSLIQQSDKSVKFFIPASLGLGAYSVTLYGENETVTVYLNAPAVKWAQGDEGSAATAGGWLRLNGEKLSLNGEAPRVWLESEGEYKALSEVRYIDAYSAEVKIPEDILPGTYNAVLSNGYGGKNACSVPVAVHITAKPCEARKTLNVLDFGGDPMGEKDSTNAFAAAFGEAEKLGGAIVYVPRGRYWLTDALYIPDNTVLRGESKTRSQLFWTPFKWEHCKRPEVLISGDSDITIEDLDFRGTRVMALFWFGICVPDARNIKIRRIRARFNSFSGSEYFVDRTENRMEIYNEINQQGTRGLVCVAGDNVQITDSEFASTGMTFGNTFEHVKYNFLFKNNRVEERIRGWAYFVHCDNSIIEDNEFDGTTVGFGGSNSYFARNNIHDVLDNNREAFTTDMSYSALTMNPIKIEGTKIVFPPEVKLSQDRVIGYGGLYVNNGKGSGQARRVVAFCDNVAEIDSPFAVEPDEKSEISFGGTFRTAFYLINNRCCNTGHIQFFVDQCSSVYDGNEMVSSGGIMVYSWQEAHNAWDETQSAEKFAGTLPLLTRTQTNFISVINNRIADGNYFHTYGKQDECHADHWSGFASIGCRLSSVIPTNTGMLIKNNALYENSFIRILSQPVKGHEDSSAPCFEDGIIDNNTVSNSGCGIDMGKSHASRLLISRNDFSNNVDAPMKIDWEINKGDIEII